MKLPKIILSVIVASFLTAGFAFATASNAASDSKKAGCCVKAEKDGKTCDHACCVDAAKEGKNCEKCGGSGKAETKH